MTKNLKAFLNEAWRVIRYFKPMRTFWQTLVAVMAVKYSGIDSGAVGIEDIEWLTILSASAAAAAFSFITLLKGGDSLWSEPASYDYSSRAENEELIK